MRWKNKGNELEMYKSSFLKNKRIYLFGYGQLGKVLAETLYQFDMLYGIIDNDINKQNQIVHGKKIISLDEFLKYENRQESYIVVSVSVDNCKDIGQQLKENGLIYGKDFFNNKEFVERILPIIMLYQKNCSFVSLAQISVTERCTLKCRKCAHGCYAVNNSREDFPLDEVYKSADSFFKKVDYIQEFVLIGGETLLYKQLAEAIEYIGNRYRHRMTIFTVTTNGTIIPSEDVLRLSKEFNVLFKISNYTKTLPQLKRQHELLTKTLDDYDVSYILGRPEKEWMDYGFEYVNRTCTEDELIKVFSSCNTPCREIRGNKFYFCVMARTVSENLGFHIGQDDYLDLEELNGKDYKKILLEFNLGYSEKGYLDMCRHCHGNEAKNYPIPAAEQL